MPLLPSVGLGYVNSNYWYMQMLASVQSFLDLLAAYPISGNTGLADVLPWLSDAVSHQIGFWISQIPGIVATVVLIIKALNNSWLLFDGQPKRTRQMGVTEDGYRGFQLVLIGWVSFDLLMHIELAVREIYEDLFGWEPIYILITGIKIVSFVGLLIWLRWVLQGLRARDTFKEERFGAYTWNKYGLSFGAYGFLGATQIADFTDHATIRSLAWLQKVAT